jgi:raffinose/stachyose/melibiose transport system permease protein
MFLLTVLGIVFTLTVPLIVAELIFHLRTERMRYYMRAAFLIPLVIPGVIIFLIWGEFYADAGLIPQLGRVMGLGGLLEGLLSHPQTAHAPVFSEPVVVCLSSS